MARAGGRGAPVLFNDNIRRLIELAHDMAAARIKKSEIVKHQIRELILLPSLASPARHTQNNLSQ